MNKDYEHTQFGYLTVTAIGAALLYIIYLLVVNGFNWVTSIVIVILVISLFAFATLKTTIVDELLEIRLGIGIIRRVFHFSDIKSVQVIKYPWYYGWGIRLSLRGEWIYSVSGLQAIKIDLKSGEKYIIGTDEPDRLASAIQNSMESRS